MLYNKISKAKNLLCVWFQFCRPIGEETNHRQKHGNYEPSDYFVRDESEIVIAEEYHNKRRILDIGIDAVTRQSAETATASRTCRASSSHVVIVTFSFVQDVDAT
jgi:hypothetical protein